MQQHCAPAVAALSATVAVNVRDVHWSEDINVAQSSHLMLGSDGDANIVSALLLFGLDTSASSRRNESHVLYLHPQSYSRMQQEHCYRQAWPVRDPSVHASFDLQVSQEKQVRIAKLEANLQESQAKVQQASAFAVSTGLSQPCCMFKLQPF